MKYSFCRMKRVYVSSRSFGLNFGGGKSILGTLYLLFLRLDQFNRRPNWIEFWAWLPLMWFPWKSAPILLEIRIHNVFSVLNVHNARIFKQTIWNSQSIDCRNYEQSMRVTQYTRDKLLQCVKKGCKNTESFVQIHPNSFQIQIK